MNEDTLRIITEIYDSILEPSNWSNVLSTLVALTNSESALLLSCSNKPQHCGIDESCNIDPYWLKLYDEHYYQYDPSMEVLSQSPNTVLSNHVLFLVIKKFNCKNRVFYNEVLLPQNFFYSASCCMILPGQNNHALIMTRNKKQNEYSLDRLRQIQLVINHLSKALFFSQKMWDQGIFNEKLSDVLGRIGVSLILFNQKGTPAYISKQAEMDINSTKWLHLKNGTIKASQYDDDVKLQKLIRGSVTTVEDNDIQGGGCLRLGDSESSVQLAVTRMNHEIFGDNRFEQPVYAALIISKENSSPKLPQKPLMELYGLTLAEANLVTMLTEGLDLNEIAEHTRRSKETLRSHLKSVMGKTSTKRQSDLVRLVTSSVSRFM